MTAGQDEAAAQTETFQVPDDHITAQLGTWISYDDRGAIARTTLGPAMWGAGSPRPRLAVFASIADALGGQTPEPTRFPTIDLRTHLVADAPSTGPIKMVGNALRVGSRFVVVEITMYDEHAAVFGRATATFLNNVSSGRSPSAPFEPADRVESVEGMLDARPVDERTLEIAPKREINNLDMDTPFGGAQAWLAELTAEHLAAEPLTAIDLDIRFLQPVKVGPLRAIATRIGPPRPLHTYRVDLVDAGADSSLVSAVTVVGSTR